MEFYVLFFCAVCFNVVLSSLLVAPPLTSDFLLPLLKGVKSWRKLAKGLLYAIDKEDNGLPLPPVGYSEHNLDDLQLQCGTDEDCLKAVIEIFLQGRGRYKQPSWEAVLQSLYDANELRLAASIKSYAEPLQGVCITFIDGIVKQTDFPLSMILNHLNVPPKILHVSSLCIMWAVCYLTRQGLKLWAFNL